MFRITGYLIFVNGLYTIKQTKQKKKNNLWLSAYSNGLIVEVTNHWYS